MASMDMEILVRVGMAVAVLGFFCAAWFRYSRPVRLMNGKERIVPSV